MRMGLDIPMMTCLRSLP